MARRRFAELPDFVVDACNRFERHEKPRIARRRAWRPIKLPDDRPFGVLWVGDPHIDDDKCDWPQLVSHIQLARTTPGLYAVNVDDVTNNWVGRLTRLFAEQNAGQKEARRRIKWLMHGAGVPWAFWLLGNHDAWNEGDTIIDLMSDGRLPVFDWEARVEFTSGKEKFRVHVAHDFPGQSMWNIVHGPGRAARMGSLAELYVCGHKHDWGTASFEIAGHDRVVHTARARGYKADDRHALVNGFQQSTNGASILTVFNPRAKSPAGRITTFTDVEVGAQFLGLLRSGNKRTGAKRGGKKCSTLKTQAR